FTTLTPFGPVSGELYLCVQSTAPVLKSTACTLEARSCQYITPPTTTGVVAYAPKVPVAVSGTVHATPSVPTFEESIGPPTWRVFCRSAPGKRQPPPSLPLDETVAACLLDPHAATRRQAATDPASTSALRRVPTVMFVFAVFIGFLSVEGSTFAYPRTVARATS